MATFAMQDCVSVYMTHVLSHIHMESGLDTFLVQLWDTDSLLLLPSLCTLALAACLHCTCCKHATIRAFAEVHDPALRRAVSNIPLVRRRCQSLTCQKQASHTSKKIFAGTWFTSPDRFRSIRNVRVYLYNKVV